MRKLAFYGKLPYFTPNKYCSKPETAAKAMKIDWLYGGKY